MGEALCLKACCSSPGPVGSRAPRPVVDSTEEGEAGRGYLGGASPGSGISVRGWAATKELEASGAWPRVPQESLVVISAAPGTARRRANRGLDCGTGRDGLVCRCIRLTAPQGPAGSRRVGLCPVGSHAWNCVHSQPIGYSPFFEKPGLSWDVGNI